MADTSGNDQLTSLVNSDGTLPATSTPPEPSLIVPPEDILAAKTAPVGLPPEPTPDPILTGTPTISQPAGSGISSGVGVNEVNASSPQPPVPASMDALSPVATALPEISPSPEIPNDPPAETPKRKFSGVGIMVMLLLLLIALPVAVYYVSQQQSLNDIRNRASTPYPDKLCNIKNNDCPAGQRCHCQDGNACTKTACETDDQTYTSCKNQGRSWCVNQGGEAYTCCVKGYTCGDSDGCYKTGGGGGGGGGGDTPTPTRPGSTNTPTNTPTGTLTSTPTNTPTGTLTSTPTNTPTNTPTATPTSTVGCDSACTINTDCNSGLVCADSRCRNPQCTEQSSCQCSSDTPTNTPTVTATPTPTPIAYVGCNSACTVNTDCSSGLVCIDSACRNPSCTEKTTCQCDEIAIAPTPQTPVAGTGPSVLGAAVIAGGFFLLLFGLAL